MSAYKTAIVRLGEREYKRLREAEEKLRLLDLEGRVERKNQDNSIYERMLAEGRARDQRFGEIVQGLSANISGQAHLEEEMAQWNQDQNVIFQKRLIQTVDDQADWNAQVTSELEQRNQARAIQLAHREYELEEQVRVDAQDARSWIENAATLVANIQDEYALDLVSANELEMQRCELEEAARQVQAGRGDRAFQTARSAWNGLTRLRHLLEGQRAALAACRQDLVMRSEMLLDRIQNGMFVHAMDCDGNELSEEIDVNFWTEGAYGSFVEQTRQAQAAVLALHGADLIEMGEWREELDLLDEKALELVTQARLAVLASQLRFNVAQIVVHALETQGFYLEEAAYNRNDFRGAFIARTRSLAGSEVLVTIDPDPGLEEGGRLNIQSGDALQVTEHELLQRNREIFQAIQQEGLEVAETKPGNTPLQPLSPLTGRTRTHLARPGEE